MKLERGEANVFDFSLGNPCLDPPPDYLESLRAETREPPAGRYAYMPNAGYPETRAAVAAELRRRRGLPLEGKHVVMTCGAAGGLNVVLKTLLDPGEEVILLAPCFAEYIFYVDCVGHRTDPPLQKAIESLKALTLETVLLGSYPAAEELD